MNAGLYLAATSILVLLLAKPLDLVLEKIDLHIFRHQLNSHRQLGLEVWFGGSQEGGLGEVRAKTVLKYALLAASARAALLSLVVNMVALTVTWAILANANPQPSFLGARIIGVVLTLTVVAWALLNLCIQLIKVDLAPNPVHPAGTGVKKRSQEYWRRFRRRRYLTVYNTVVVVSGASTGILGFGV